MKSLTRHLVGGAVLASFLFSIPAAGHADTIIFDDCNDGSLNRSLWLPLVAMGSGSVSEVQVQDTSVLGVALDDRPGISPRIIYGDQDSRTNSRSPAQKQPVRGDGENSN